MRSEANMHKEVEEAGKSKERVRQLPNERRKELSPQQELIQELATSDHRMLVMVNIIKECDLEDVRLDVALARGLADAIDGGNYGLVYDRIDLVMQDLGFTPQRIEGVLSRHEVKPKFESIADKDLPFYREFADNLKIPFKNFKRPWLDNPLGRWVKKHEK